MMATGTTSAAPAEKFVEAGGVRTRYLEAGSGPDTVVLLHGSGPGVTAAANWSKTIPALAGRHRVLAPEMVGYGASRGPDDIRYGVSTWTDHILAFLDAVDVSQVSFVGNSMGGLVSLHIAIREPERVSRMVLMGSPGVGMQPTEGLAALRAYEPSIETMRDLLTRWFAYDTSIVTDELVRARYEASRAGDAHEIYHSMFHNDRHTGNDLELRESDVRRINAPTLLVHGLNDKVVPIETSWTMAHLLPDVRLHVFGRCGHWTQIEKALEFSRLISDFLEG